MSTEAIPDEELLEEILAEMEDENVVEGVYVLMQHHHLYFVKP